MNERGRCLSETTAAGAAELRQPPGDTSRFPITFDALQLRRDRDTGKYAAWDGDAEHRVVRLFDGALFVSTSPM